MLKEVTYIVLSLIFIINSSCSCLAQSEEETEKDITIYQVNPELLDSFETIKKGTVINLVLNNDVSTKNDTELKKISLTALDNNKNPVNAKGLITHASKAGIFSRNSSLQLSLRSINSGETGELFFPASSSLFSEVHPPHANTNSIGLGRTITNLSTATAPATFGVSLGISFLLGGLLSSYQNGIGDFIWGGFDGSGLSLVENLFRKQPETFLRSGTVIPFSLNQDIKISQGIKIEKQNYTNLSKEDTENRIETLLKWGDLAGALETAAKTNQSEKYNQLLEKISSK